MHSNKQLKEFIKYTWWADGVSLATQLLEAKTQLLKAKKIAKHFVEKSYQYPSGIREITTIYEKEFDELNEIANIDIEEE